MALASTSSFRLSLPYTVIPDGDRVHLVAGEDARTTLSGRALGEWLPELLGRLEGRTLGEALTGLPPTVHERALGVLERLLGERILIEAPLPRALPPLRVVIDGAGAIRDWLEAHPVPPESNPNVLSVFCQDRLDYDAVLRFQAARRNRGEPWIWASCGAMARGFVSPVFLPHAGPCFHCLLSSFVRLSPAPEIYDLLISHATSGGEILPVPFPTPGVTILGALVVWKTSQLVAEPVPDSAFRLHVLEASALELTSHRVLMDPTCPVCGAP